AISVQSFCEWAKGQRGEVGQADKDQDHADEHADEQRFARVQGSDAGRDPARPRAKISGANRPSSMTMPPIVLYQTVFVVRPAKAEPLLLASEAKAYMISVSPCGPGLSIDDSGDVVGDGQFLSASESPAAVSVTTGMVRKYSDAYFISTGLIFLPMYSGVRPTISPPTNTVTIASTS